MLNTRPYSVSNPQTGQHPSWGRFLHMIKTTWKHSLIMLDVLIKNILHGLEVYRMVEDAVKENGWLSLRKCQC